MKLACLALVLAACHSAPTAPVAHHVAPPAKLGPTVTRAQLVQMSNVDAKRLEDRGGQILPTMETKSVIIDANVISAMSCRPNGSTPALVADSRYVYVTFEVTMLSPPTHLDGSGPMMTPSTYCSYQRFVIPDGLEYGGELKIVP